MVWVNMKPEDCGFWSMFPFTSCPVFRTFLLTHCQGLFPLPLALPLSGFEKGEIISHFPSSVSDFGHFLGRPFWFTESVHIFVWTIHSGSVELEPFLVIIMKNDTYTFLRFKLPWHCENADGTCPPSRAQLLWFSRSSTRDVSGFATFPNNITRKEH